LYGQITALSQDAQSGRDTTAIQELIADLENMSRQAHKTSGFTYASLSELAALQK